MPIKAPVIVAITIMLILSTKYHHCFSLIKVSSAAIMKDTLTLHSAAVRVAGTAVVAHSHDDSIIRVADFLSRIAGPSMK
jgi:hypothetical protein